MGKSPEIVSWAERGLEEEDFKSVSKLRSGIKEYTSANDTRGGWDNYTNALNKSGKDWIDQPNLKGRSLGQRVDQTNLDYIDNATTEINRISIPTDLQSYKTNLDTSYESDTIEKISDIIDEKLGSFLDVADKAFRDKIDNARTVSTLEKLADDWRDVGGDGAKIARTINARAEELGFGKILS